MKQMERKGRMTCDRAAVATSGLSKNRPKIGVSIGPGLKQNIG
jgi:hypothetical protein